jgi:predicted transcriptional regulator
VEWWLLEQQIKRETAKVKEALQELVSEGLVLERNDDNSPIHYRVNRLKLKEIQALLKKGFK